jgi:mediator of RNA polymerase II transcription subunit 14
MAELPPELAHIPEDSLVSLNKLFERAAQETFNDLHQCLHSMADLPIGQLPNGALTNGVGGHANGHVDNSDANMKRKLLIMNFAQEARARFIKLLVINGWAKKTAAQMSKLFDIFEWEKIEYESQTWGYHVFQDMKTKIYALGQRNPDIRTALQVLSKGKADWIPDVCFAYGASVDAY